MGTQARFLEADIKRAVNGVAKAGVRDARVEIAPDGTISIIIGSGSRIAVRRNSCDDILDMK